MRDWYVLAKYIENYPSYDKKNYFKCNRGIDYKGSEYYVQYVYFGSIRYALFIKYVREEKEEKWLYTGNEMKIGDKYIKNDVEHKVESILHNDDENYSVYVMKDIVNKNKDHSELLNAEIEKMNNFIPEFRKMISDKLYKRSFWEIVKDTFFQ
ncbi:hypothetical protein FJQ98_16320 [Lysinibacillus agricola]|uniref:DUF402 domain-containing protein n=1 Tax=Lysinibacillus agricola TaxID=2590012 RepID=A0ABX7ALZ6_9BACI|nr:MULTISPECIES: hypothetical protein [Lysinibacillus]KOS61500.1 hypothetical protein AN161_18090 [Lysinibacillus sp. FJAT-14222]QQP10810.1 hypothetical protein FJQ98_16320 [Lysinibacillus agricola]